MSKRFWLGIIGGTVFGLLFAKKSGKETREALVAATKKEGITGGLRELGKEFGAMGEEVVESIEDVTGTKHGTVTKTIARNKAAFRRGAAKTVKKVKEFLPDEESI